MEHGSPRQRTTQVEELIVTANLNDPNIIRNLELYVLEEVMYYNLYSFNANCCLLRFYRDNREKTKIQCVRHILITGLIASPKDFYQYLSLLSKYMRNHPEMQHLCNLLSLLENRNFPKVWEEVKCDLYKYMFYGIAGFEPPMEEYITNLLSSTYYGKVPKHIFSMSLAKVGRDLEGYIEFGVTKEGWVVEKNEFGRPVINIPHSSIRAIIRSLKRAFHL